MTILERVQQDIERGDIGLARDRLSAHLNSKGYDPALLETLGDLSNQMHDRFTAGRHWFLSSAQGEHVELAIKEFARRCGNRPEQMLQALPVGMLPTKIDQVPACARSHVKAYGMESLLITVRQTRGKPAKYQSTFRDRLAMLGALCFLLFIVICLCAGIPTVTGWIFSLLTS